MADSVQPSLTDMENSEPVGSENLVSAAGSDSAGITRVMSSTGYATRLLAGLDCVRADGLFCDYVIAAGGVEISVHRAVLVASSEYFRAMLTGSMCESRGTRVELQGMTSAGLQAVIEFMYSGSVKLSLKNVQEVLAAASHLLVTEVVDLCATFLNESIEMDTAVDILNISDIYSLATSNRLANEFILSNFETLAVELPSEFAKLSVMQLEVLLADNALNVASEYQLFRIVLGWIQDVDVPTRAPLIAQLLRHVRVPLCSSEELVEVSREPLVTGNAECYGLLEEAKDYHLAVYRQPLLQTSRTQAAACADRIYVSGGLWDDNRDSRCVMSYDPVADEWREEPPMLVARWGHSMATIADTLYVVGGLESDNPADYGSDPVERYCPGLGSHTGWTACATIISVDGASMTAVDDWLYIVGGIDQTERVHGADAVLVYKPNDDKIEKQDKLLIDMRNCIGRASCSLVLP